MNTTARVAEKQEEIEEEEETQQLKANAEKEVASVTTKRNEEMSKGGKLKKLQEEVGDLGQALAKMKAQVEIKMAASRTRKRESRQPRFNSKRSVSPPIYFILHRLFETNRFNYSQNQR